MSKKKIQSYSNTMIFLFFELKFPGELKTPLPGAFVLKDQAVIFLIENLTSKLINDEDRFQFQSRYI